MAWIRAERKKVIVTGCYDWLHSGHVRFFEEVSAWATCTWSSATTPTSACSRAKAIRCFRQDERRYMVQSIRFVKQALITSGRGWMDAEPEIAVIQPDIYAVNEDGDKPEKREFCAQHGLEYVVLKRTPKEGLPKGRARLCEAFN